jgi:dolichol-phosphate mannosyltransferase
MPAKTQKTLVVLPTYNEASNIKALIEKIFETGKKSGLWIDILVVDDNSPDGTALIVKKLQEKSQRLHLSSGPKQGLGKAYVRGFKKGLELKKYTFFVMMDADFSHDPRDIPKLLKAMKPSVDVVIGSRYLAKSFIDKNWPWRRALQSKLANLGARYIASLPRDISDYTGGFRALRVSNLSKIKLDEVSASGYGFMISLLDKLIKENMRIKEVPITFTNRLQGKSKMRRQDIIEFIRLLYKLNPDSPVPRMMRFGLVGASGTVVNLACLAFLVEVISLPALLAAALAIEASIISNFSLNHIYTFRSLTSRSKVWYRENSLTTLHKLFKYNLIALSGAAISFSVFALLYKVVGVHYVPADLIAIAAATSWNYLMSVRIVWKVVDTKTRRRKMRLYKLSRLADEKA